MNRLGDLGNKLGDLQSISNEVNLDSFLVSPCCNNHIFVCDSAGLFWVNNDLFITHLTQCLQSDDTPHFSK